MRLLWELAPREITIIAIVTLLTGLAPLASLVVLRAMVDAAAQAVTRGTGMREALGWVVALVAARALQGAVHTVGSFVQDATQQRLKAQVQERVIAKAQALPLAAFEQPSFYNQLQRVEEGLEGQLHGTISWTFSSGSRAVTLVALFLYIGTAHWSLPLIMTVGSLFFVSRHIRFVLEKHLLEQRQTEPQRRLETLASLMTGRETAAEVRCFGLGDHLLQTWSQLSHSLRGERLDLVRRTVRSDGLSLIGRSLTVGAALAVVVHLASRGALSIGQFAALLAALQQFHQELRDLIWGLAVIDVHLRTVRDCFLYLDLPDETAAGSASAAADGTQSRCAATPASQEKALRASTTPKKVASEARRRSLRTSEASLRPIGSPSASAANLASITFEKVSFAYPGSDHLVLDGINLQLRPGERIALVGENGAGKTTLARLLLGLYRPTAGRVCVDGVDLAAIPKAVWRRRTAAIFQEFQQYHMTVRQNIALGDLSRGDDSAAIERVAQLAGADSVVATLSSRYDTLLGKDLEEGTELSLGQWQKIAVARAYLRDAEVLVLDEPTASLDARAEVEVYRRFRDVSEGKTVLLISHRLGSARLADRIVVLAAGRIVEEGTHAELMERDGIYARMLGTQAQWYA
jgi:ATP-binding cassette subfamily B protein